MSSKKSRAPVRLFYSYCHQDAKFRDDMERCLRPLEDAGLVQWSDEQISPGAQFSAEIRTQLNDAHIVVFLISPNFLDSEPCRDEWALGKENSKSNSSVLIPVVLRPCGWADFDDMSHYLALPKDGQPVSSFTNPDEAWMEVYEGIKSVVEDLRSKPKMKPSRLNELAKVGMISQHGDLVRLSDIFEFPVIHATDSQGASSVPVSGASSILRRKRILLHGDILSGKTSLCVHLMEHLEKGSQAPTLYVDLAVEALRRPSMDAYEKLFSSQCDGAFARWKASRPLVILDNLSSTEDSKRHLRFCIKQFDRVIVTTLSDVYFAYRSNLSELVDFDIMHLQPLTHVKQERLVRKWLRRSSAGDVSHAQIDGLEREVNSVIVDNRILPRYPYYVLSILQMREGFMPKDLKMTAYGHCHYMMILACLIKSGVGSADSGINACLNFASHFAYFLFTHHDGWRNNLADSDFPDFVSAYRGDYLLDDRTLQRLQHKEYGIIGRNNFRASYMYYYFLGKYMADNGRSPEVRQLVEEMAAKCYVTENSFVLMSVIHHSADAEVIDDIVIRNLCSLDHVPPATLTPPETKAIEEMLRDMPADYLSNEGVETERERVRGARDEAERNDVDIEEDSPIEDVNDIYRILKYNEILGQIIRNKHGDLTKSRLKEIIGSITECGLRVVSLILLDRDQILSVAEFVKEHNPDATAERICSDIAKLSFFTCVVLLSRIASQLNKRELQELVQEVLRDDAANDVIRYFVWLAGEDRFLEGKRASQQPDVLRLRKLWNRHNDKMLRRIISLATQHYINTHTTAAQAKQAVTATLQPADAAPGLPPPDRR